MARRIRSAQLDSRSARLALPIRRRLYTAPVARGLRIGYRRLKGEGTWSVVKADGQGGYWIDKVEGIVADDIHDADGVHVLDFWQACKRVREIALGEGESVETVHKPVSVETAIDTYERDLIARDANPRNAKWLRYHLTPALKSKLVSLLTPREVRALRDGLFDKGLTRASVNRYMKVFCAALTLAANDDERIGNRKAWKLPALPDATKSRNVILTDAQVRDAVAASYETGGVRFGVYIETLAVTGTRPIQARRLTVADLEADHRDGPRVMMPSSKKGRGKKRIDRTALPIPAGLATRLKAEAAGRADDEPLLRDDNGRAWTENTVRRFDDAAVAGKLPQNAGAYALRHSSIVRALLRGVPVRLVAAAHDTSVAMIEKTYSKYITNPGADLMRGVLLDLSTPAVDNVVPLPSRAKDSQEAA